MITMPKDRTTTAPTKQIKGREYRDWLRRFKPSQYRIMSNGLDYYLQYYDDQNHKWMCVNDLPRNLDAWRYSPTWQQVDIEVVPGHIVEMVPITEKQDVENNYKEIMALLQTWHPDLVPHYLKDKNCSLICAYCGTGYPRDTYLVLCTQCGAPLREK